MFRACLHNSEHPHIFGITICNMEFKKRWFMSDRKDPKLFFWPGNILYFKFEVINQGSR